jgi:aminoglycoside phosphotransferase (APT) family kinase protein
MTVDASALPDDAVANLEETLSEAFGGQSFRLTEMKPLSAGSSRMTWVLGGTTETDHHRLVLQRERVRGAGYGDVAAEARLLRAAAAAGVPVPHLVAVDPVGQALGGAYTITTKVEGETLPKRLLRKAAYAPARAAFARDCGRILAGIHAIPVEQVEPLERRDQIESVHAMFDRAGLCRPVFELALRWLDEHRPEPLGRTSVVHGDFRNGNFVVGEEGVRAVLDWELAHLGDAREDLGWLTSRAWRFGERAVVGGIGAEQDLVSSYEQHSGISITTEVMFWWRLMATVKWGAICMEQTRTHLSGDFPAVSLAVLGRKVAEVEYDVLRMLP